MTNHTQFSSYFVTFRQCWRLTQGSHMLVKYLPLSYISGPRLYLFNESEFTRLFFFLIYSVPLRAVYQLFTPHCEFTHLSPSDNTHPPDVSFEELGEQLGNFITKCLGLAWPWAAGNCLTAPQEERGLQLLKQQSHFPSRKLQVP